ncbi:MAG TPA: type II toxin-antitoxin system prevent-host-death family antitoxin [Solirubrobacteraceae bacterium]|jgi:prevent-host-death family protein|nr:type II toxin-antitoxin system prevent-host-death family antitoxin [Solirubrobacteraceae bacterium]
MREIGVRELKASLSSTLRSVSRGQRVRITVRGQPVADIVPADAAVAADELRLLVSQGRLVAPTRPHPRRAPDLVAGTPSASSLVLADREAER